MLTPMSSVLFLVISLLPYLWIVLASFKARPDLLVQPPRWVFSPTLENYRQILVEKGFDVLKVTDPAAQSNVKMNSLNPQSQPPF